MPRSKSFRRSVSPRFWSFSSVTLGCLGLLSANCGAASSDGNGSAGTAGSSVSNGGSTPTAGTSTDMGGSVTVGATSAGGNPNGGVDGGGATPGGGTPGAGSPADGGAASTGGPPNVIFILTDDLSWNLVKYMPHVQQMQKEGVTFSNYFVTDSLCCPSRSSIFTGKFPHNTGVFTNDAPNGGYPGFLKKKNQLSTYATSLSGAGYQTAMMGKYLNLYSVDTPADPGWKYWAVADNGYPEFDYYLRINDTKKYYGKMPADYGVDVLSGLGQAFVSDNATKPFSLEVATFAPHGPFTPAPRYENAFPELAADPQHLGTPPAAFPVTPAWDARPGPDAPNWEKGVPALTDQDKADGFGFFRKRAQAVQAVDDMIAALRDELTKKGLADNTYFIFSSDNGYHIGEHSMYQGKQTAYDTDIRVPLIIVGPGVPAGVTVDDVTQNIDLCPTFSDLAGLPAEGVRDGRTLVPLIHGEKVADWRELALVEHRNPGYDPNDPDTEPGGHVDPPSYEAIATGQETYVEYATGEHEYFEHGSDPDELTNAYGSLGAAKKSNLHDALAASKACKGAAACWAAQHFPK